MSSSPPRPRRFRVYAFSIGLAAIVAVALLLRGCLAPRVEAREYLFVPADLAGLRGLDRDGVLAYCRSEVRPADYPGVARGAHGALWAGEANGWDRALLAVAALGGLGVEARVVPGEPPRVAYRDGPGWVVARLDADGPAEPLAEPPAEIAETRPELFHTLTPEVVLDRKDGQSEHVGGEAPQHLADWAYRPVVLEAIAADGQAVYALRVGTRTVLRTPPLAGVRRAELRLTWKHGDRSETWSRELFDRANARPDVPGRDAVRVGERYAVAAAAGPLVAEALPARVRMMELAEYTPVEDATTRTLVTAAVKYQAECDEQTRALAKECQVAVTWTTPRITIAASSGSAGDRDDPPPGLTLDALADTVEATGARAREFHVARGLANDTIETRVLFEATRRPVVSASTVLSHFKSDAADAPARRVGLLIAEAERLVKTEPLGATVTFTSALPPYLTGEEADRLKTGLGTVRMERTSAGLAVHGLVQKDAAPAEEPWKGYAWDAAGSVAFADPAELALVVDGMLARKLGRLDHVLKCEARSAWPLDALPVVAGSLLTYKATVAGKEHRLLVTVRLKDGKPTGTWTDAATGKGGDLAGSWPDVLAAGPTLGAVLADALPEGTSTRTQVLVGPNDRYVEGRAVELAGGSAVLLATARFPLVLSWKRGDMAMTLESVSPVVQGRVRDAETAAAVPAARIGLVGTVRKATRGLVTDHPAAGDGTFAVPVRTRPQRLLLILDRSGSMRYGLDPKAVVGPRDEPPPADQQRMHFLRREAHRLLAGLSPTVEVALWSFTTGPLDRDLASPRHVRIDCPYTADHAQVKAAIDRLEPAHGTPLTGVVVKLAQHLKDDPLSGDAVVVLLTDGENEDKTTTLADAYDKAGGTSPVHAIGFAIETNGRADRDLRGLAETTGGTYRIAGSGEALRLAFGNVADQLADVELRVETTCHAPAVLRVPASDLGVRRQDVRLSHGCATCKCSGKALLTITRDTVGRLAECIGLSPKARGWIEARVKDGTWTVTIPNRRVNVGRVSAYAWWEAEAATGRLVGRTEDGLHGSSADDAGYWPPLVGPDAAGHLPFVAWYQGIVSYTTGSVLAGLKWHREPGFLNGTREDFLRFVQANALAFSARWWGEVGSQAFPENLHAYWSGVCLNFTLQSLAVGMPSTACHREWAKAFCDKVAGGLKDLPPDVAKERFDGAFGPEYRQLYDATKRLRDLAARRGVPMDGPPGQEFTLLLDGLDKFKKRWEDGVDAGFDCKRFGTVPRDGP